MNTNTQAQVDSKNRRTLIIALAVFLLPVIVAAILHKTGLYKSVGTSNRGQLINPPLAFETLPLLDQYATSIDPETLKQHWWMVYLMPEQCDAACKNSLYQMRQVHIALGPEQSRVARLLISTSALSAENAELIKTEFPKLRVAQTSAADLQALFDSVSDHELKTQQAGRIYLVDTMGAMFMYYPTFQDEQESILKGRDLLKDLQKVLKLSKIG
jgi:hypothetical protein